MQVTRDVSELIWANRGTAWMAWFDDLASGQTPVFSAGYTATVAGNSVTVSNATAPTGTVTYGSSRDAATCPQDMYAFDGVADEYDVVAGKITRPTKTVDLSTLEWTEDDGVYSATVDDIKLSTDNILLPNGYSGTVSGSTLSVTASESPTGVALYERDASVTVDVTAGQVTLVSGENTALQTDSGRAIGGLSLGYSGTSYDIATISGQKYLKRINGTDTIVNGGSSVSVVGGRDLLLNLTRWCGAGLEPATVDEFYLLYPFVRNWQMPYNAGNMIGYNGTGIQTKGFNAYDPSTGQAVLLGGHQYQMTGTYTAISYSTGETLTPDANGLFTPTLDGVLTVTGGGSDTCVHLTWNGYRNGEYEDYWSQTRSLPIATYFPDGMHGDGSVWDSLFPNRAVHRYATVDMATLTWTESSGVYSASVSGIKADTVHAFTDAYAVSVSGTTVSIASASSPTGYLVYEAATSVETPIDPPLPMTYKVADFGTEEALPQNFTTSIVTSPFRGVIAYSDDFTRQVATLPKNYVSVSSMEAFLTTLAAAGGPSITMKWNENTKQYDFEEA